VRDAFRREQANSLPVATGEFGGSQR